MHTRKSFIFYWATLIFYMIIVVKLSITHWLLSPPNVDKLLLIWLFRITPLLIFIPTFIYKFKKGFIWLCFVSLFYFITASVALVQNLSLNNWFDTVTILLLFVCSMFYFKFYN